MDASYKDLIFKGGIGQIIELLQYITLDLGVYMIYHQEDDIIRDTKIVDPDLVRELIPKYVSV